MLSSKRLKILVCDAATFRTDNFRLARKENEPAFALRVTGSRAEAEKALRDETWDLVFHSGYIGNWNSPFELKEDLERAWRANRISGVVVYNPLKSEGKEFCIQLHNRGIPVLYYPFDHSRPSVHVKEAFLHA